MANYLDPTQRREIEALAQRFTAKTEWPTWLLLIGVYTGWFAVILGSHWLGLWLSTLLLIPLVTLGCRCSTNCCMVIPPGHCC